MGWKIYLPQDILPEGREYLESHGPGTGKVPDPRQ